MKQKDLAEEYLIKAKENAIYIKVKTKTKDYESRIDRFTIAFRALHKS